MTTDGGGWTRVNGNIATSSIGFGANDILRGVNNSNTYGCSKKTNFVVNNFKLSYMDYRAYLTRETTILQCSALTNYTHSYYIENGNLYSRGTCTWGDGFWANAAPSCNMTSSLKKYWVFFGTYSSSIAYTVNCSYSSDNGYYNIYLYIR